MYKAAFLNRGKIEEFDTEHFTPEAAMFEALGMILEGVGEAFHELMFVKNGDSIVLTILLTDTVDHEVGPSYANVTYSWGMERFSIRWNEESKEYDVENVHVVEVA